MDLVASPIAMSFFHLYFSFQFELFSRFAVSQKRLQLESKSYLTTTGLFLQFFVGICLVLPTSYLHGLKFA